MNDDLRLNADLYWLEHTGLSLDALLAPVDALLPAGASLRNDAMYKEIRQARRQDDASLPMGAWEHELKRADWDGLTRLTTQALAQRSKDLQLAAWLLEAQLHLNGFAGIPAGVTLIQDLCERFWDGLHPLPSDGNYDHRANVFRWINEKLLTALRQIALTQSGAEREFNWADWEQVQRNEQLRSAAGGRNAPVEGVDMPEVARAMASTPASFYSTLFYTLADATEALGLLGEVLDQRFAGDAPGLSAFSGVLMQIKALAGAELHKRGVRPALHARSRTSGEAAHDALPIRNSANPGGPEVISLASRRVRDGDDSVSDLPGGGRERAYAQLAEAAETLLRLEPHSPVPYVIRKAVEWGALDTVQLYQELFLQQGGQLNIFQLLGLDPATAKA
jgi:type VI secretion system protein ImpA